jgi:hypothetical protein
MTATRKRTPDQQREREALQRLVQYPEWEVFVSYFRGRLDRETIDRQAPNTGALLLIEGRRSLHRDISELPRRLSDERRSGSGDE